MCFRPCPLWNLVQTDDLVHVADAFTQEGIQVGARITEVRAPAGTVEHIIVAGFAVGSTVTAGVEVFRRGGLHEVDDDVLGTEGLLDNSLVSLGLSGVDFSGAPSRQPGIPWQLQADTSRPRRP